MTVQKDSLFEPPVKIRASWRFNRLNSKPVKATDGSVGILWISIPAGELRTTSNSIG
ncbi:hypothetical protein M388_01280 [Mesotoga sp. Brook.08.YT.4.2.5.4.]|nr:hypothetical protein M388_01280 [Mesotoga sp. Brook.08.YT.4.2.5.4.]